MFITASPAPTKAALKLLGHDAGGLRLPLVECDEAELAEVRTCSSATGCSSRRRAPTLERQRCASSRSAASARSART